MPLDRRAVLDFFLRDLHRPVSLKELADLMTIDRRERPRLQVIVQSLATAGELVRIKGGRFGLPRKMNLVVGELRCTPKGFGFVVPAKGGGPDVFVRQPNQGGALHGDQVVARVERNKPDGRREGSVIRVLKRQTERLLGKYELGPAYGYVVPLEEKILSDVVVPPDHSFGAEEGQIVEVVILEYPGRTREASGRIVEVIGWPDDPGIDLELVLRRSQLPREFPADVRRSARAVPKQPSAEEIGRRHDFRSDLVVTIDGEKARDFDDAVSVARLGDGGYRLQVHIADVAHYVVEGSELDEEARQRGTSVYFPDHVIPMLPEELSNGICSLKPGVDRLTLSLVLDLDRAGCVAAYRFHEGVIRSHERMTYEGVQAWLDGDDPELRNRTRHLGDLFAVMAELARLLGQRRRERGSLDFDLPESEIVLDLQGEMTGIRRGQRLVSHNIIEEFMILANEVVARHLVEEDLPGIYRIHESPSLPDVEELNRSLALFGLEVDPFSPMSFRAALEKARGRPEERFVHSLALRTLKLARYQTVNSGHFGLASQAYTHFTSPIRRYPDLAVHRLIRRWLQEDSLGAARRQEQRLELELVAEQSSRLERRAEEAEREYVERKKARFMADKVGERFFGVITAIEAFGFFVELEEYFVDGLVHLTGLHDDYYIHDEQAHRLVGEHTGRTFRLGDRLEVEVSHVDLLRRKVDFVVTEPARAEAPRADVPRSDAPKRPSRRRG